MPVRIKWPFAVHRVKALELSSNAQIITNAGAPSAATGAGTAGKGSLCLDITNGKLYVNIGTLATPSWQVAGLQS
jgi:hypothetical protein